MKGSGVAIDSVEEARGVHDLKEEGSTRIEMYFASNEDWIFASSKLAVSKVAKRGCY